jgi:type I restriction enzyme S subunit
MSEEKLPKGWRKSKLSEVVEILDNLRVPVSSSEREKRIGNIPYYGATGQTGWIDDFIFDEELVLLGEDGAPFFDKKKNVAYIVNGKSWVNNHAHVLRALTQITSNKFVLYFLNHFDYTGFVGGTTRLKLTQGSLRIIPIPLPPLPEQQRIVAKLDAVFGHLDSLREKLDRIPELLKNFRQQVLTQAVMGELTKEWREGKDLGEWEEKNLIDVIVEKPRNGFSPNGVSYKTDVKSLTLSATTKGYFDANYVKYLDIEKPDLASHLWLKNGDILIQRSNSLDYVGTAAIYNGADYDFIYPDLMMKVRANQLISTQYLYYVLSSSATKDYFRKNATGSAGNMPKINQSIVMNTPVPYPELEEQEEVVRKVESLLYLADKIESQYQSIKAKIDQLPHAILAKAFRGELVGQEVKEYVREAEELGMVAEGIEDYNKLN